MIDKDAPLSFFQKESNDNESHDERAWPVLIVDDDEQVHILSKLVLNNFVYHGKKLTILHAYSGDEALAILRDNPNVALVLLDVIMETNDAGLRCAEQIRNTLLNDTVQIVLRTGQPGDVPEQVVMQQYDINDYKCKTELTKERLFSTVTAALRAFEHVSKLKHLSDELASLNQSLELKVEQRTAELKASNNELVDAMAEIERQQFALVQAEKLASLGQLAAGVAHEINNPLGFLFSNIEFLESYLGKWHSMWKDTANASISNEEQYLQQLEVLKKNYQLDWVFDDAKDLMEDVKLGLNRIQAIVKDLGVFTAQEVQAVEDVNLSKMIQLALEKSQEIKPHSCVVETKIPEDFLIRCMGCQIGTAITNVIKNAYEAIVDEAEGKVLISIKSLDNGSLEILIEDNGRGIEPDILNRIFDPFFTTKPIGSGTGLGLSIAIAIIKSHFGDMYVESQLGLHTRVHIMLPVGKPH